MKSVPRWVKKTKKIVQRNYKFNNGPKNEYVCTPPLPITGKCYLGLWY